MIRASSSPSIATGCTLSSAQYWVEICDDLLVSELSVRAILTVTKLVFHFIATNT